MKIDDNYLDKKFLEDRTIIFEGDFDEENCFRMKRQLLQLIKEDGNKPITIYISSFGGGVQLFLMLYGILKTCSCKIITIASGFCMSAGAMLLLCGDDRLAYPGTRIMLHELAWYGNYAKLHDKTNRFKESTELQNVLNGIVKDKTKIHHVEKFMKEDNYFSVDDALKNGILNKKM